MVRDFVGRSRLRRSGHPGQRAGRSPDGSAEIQSDVEFPARRIGSLQPARIGSGLTVLAMAFALTGCWPFPSSTPSSSSPVEVSKPVSGPQTADANDAVAERFPSLDPNGRIDETPPSDAAKLEQEFDLLRAVRPDQMPPADTSRNGAPPWPTAEPPTATIPPEFKPPPAAPQSDETARTTNPAEDQTSSTMKSSPQEQPPAGEQGRRPDVEQAQRPKADESRSPKVEESRPPRARESRPPKAEESQPPNAGERPAPKARERQRSRLAHRGRRAPLENQRPTMQATKNTETPHGVRSIRNARASMEKIAVPPAGQLVLPPGLRPTRPPL
jgi:hypothetical protein